MADLAVEALTNLLCRPNSHKFPATVMQIMEKYVSLLDIVQSQLNLSEPDEVCTKYLQVVYPFTCAFLDTLILSCLFSRP